ncbi:glycosyltransferase family 2 protein [Hyphomonas sp.]|uniref:glycosyltransferase family 2 protein n=1 Tax=Hyphomonas sp. TaxID=87 RepID=UPI003F6FA873
MEIQLSTPAPTFSVIIVNYNGGDFVQGALTSLAAQTRRDFEVILVDNASSDGSIDNLDTSGLPSFTLMAETENHGFARGNNLGAARAGATWLALLNPDAAARPDWLDRIASATARHPSVSSFASLQLAMGREGIMDGAGDNYLAFGIPWRGGYGRPVRDVPVEGECFSPCGAGAIYHRQTFLSAGGFDERLFCFCEDVDLGFRLRLLGETCIFLPDAVIDHFGGGTSDKVSGFAVHHGTRNRLWVYLKNMPLPLLMLTLPGHVALTAAILARGLMTGRARDAAAGLVQAVRGVGPVLADRRRVQAARTAPLGALLPALVWNPLRMLGRGVAVRPLSSPRRGRSPAASPSRR